MLWVLAALPLLAAFFVLTERIAGRGRSRTQPILRREWFTDVVYWLTSLLLTRPLVRLVLIVPMSQLILAQLSSFESLNVAAYAGYGALSRQPIWLQFVQICLLLDLSGYWSHRLLHRSGWWQFHAVHHSSKDLDWLVTLRVHPIEELVHKLINTTLLLLLGYDPRATLIAAPILTIHTIFIHANLDWDFGPLRGVIVSPVFHRWHHAMEREAWNKNFSTILPLWDILFGTYYMPRGRYPASVGISEPMPVDYLGQLWRPFHVLLRRSKKGAGTERNRVRVSQTGASQTELV